jgi:carboxyl-terminal processing protease
VRHLAWLFLLVGCGGGIHPERGREAAESRDAAAAAPTATAAQRDAADRLAQAYLALTADSVEPARPAELAAIAWVVLGGDAPPFGDDPYANAAAFRDAARYVEPGKEWRAIDAMLASLDGAHAMVLEPAALANVMAFATGKPHAGPDFLAHRDPAGQYVVTEVLSGGAAEAAGLLPGEILLAIDGAPPGPAIAMPLLVKPPGTRIELDVERDGVLHRLRLDPAVRAHPVVRSRVVKSVAVLQIYAVVTSDDPAIDTAAQVRAAIGGLDRRRVRGLVIDLRGCPGGEGVAALASVFVTADPVLRLRDVAGAETPWPRAAAERVSWPHYIAVLVDDQTASAAEMVAFALQEQGGIRIIGQPTFGELTVPGVLELGEGKVLVYPAQQVIGPVTGEPPHAGHVVPDQLVDNRTAADLAAGRDAQLDAAVKWVTRKRP